MSSEAERIIRQQVQRIPGAKKNSGSDLMVCCPFHGETGPSCGIYMVQNGKLPFGWFNCFGCDAKGPWNKLADKLGLERVQVGDFKTSDARKDERESARVREALLPGRERATMPYSVPFDDESWRGISGRLIRDVGGVLGFDEHDGRAALFLPVRVRKRLVNVIKAKLEKVPGQLSYVITSSAKQQSLFPYDYVARMLATGNYSYVALVEGPRDALRLIDMGIPALAILGTKMWSTQKRRLVVRLCDRHGCHPLIIMDADRWKRKPGERIERDARGRRVEKRAGQLAQRNLLASFREIGYPVRGIPLEKYAIELGLKELDPATLPDKLIRRIRRLCRQK